MSSLSSSSISTVKSIAIVDIADQQDEYGKIKDVVRRYTVLQKRRIDLPVERDDNGRPTRHIPVILRIESIQVENYEGYSKATVYVSVGTTDDFDHDSAPVQPWYRHTYIRSQELHDLVTP